MNSFLLLLGSITLRAPLILSCSSPRFSLAGQSPFPLSTAAAEAGVAEKYLPPPRTPSSSHLPLLFCSSWYVSRFLASSKSKLCIHPVKADMESIPKGSPVSIYKSARVLLLLFLGLKKQKKVCPICVDLLSWNILGVVCKSTHNEQTKPAVAAAERRGKLH